MAETSPRRKIATTHRWWWLATGSSPSRSTWGTSARLRASAQLQSSLYREVTSGYLESLGARLLEGRLINEHDRRDLMRVIVINETFARLTGKSRARFAASYGLGRRNARPTR